MSLNFLPCVITMKTILASPAVLKVSRHYGRVHTVIQLHKITDVPSHAHVSNYFVCR